jgi:oxalate decarboxylase/phosphoglucose isomerase-like protein (cupin superfamily)
MPEFHTFRSMNWDGLVHEYDLDGSRLLPWDNYPMPFGGGWCVVRPKTRSLPHTQIDQEIFIGLKGTATLVIGEDERPFAFGDIAAIPKHTVHYFLNESDSDFHFYVVWWDETHARSYLAALETMPTAGVLETTPQAKLDGEHPPF